MKGKGSYFKSYKQQVAYLHNQRPKEQFNVEESKNSKFNRQQLQLSDDSNIPRSPTNNSSTQSPINRVLKQYDYGLRPLTSRACQTEKRQVWDHLYQDGLRSKKQIETAHKLKQLQIDVECTLQPTICKNNRFYTPKSHSFVERSYAWQDNKIEKLVKQKQIEIIKGLSECTFQPKLFNKKNGLSRNYRGTSKTPPKTARKLDKQKMRLKENEEKKDEKNSGLLIRHGVGVMKNIIRQELNRLNLF